MPDDTRITEPDPDDEPLLDVLPRDDDPEDFDAVPEEPDAPEIPRTDARLTRFTDPGARVSPEHRLHRRTPAPRTAFMVHYPYGVHRLPDDGGVECYSVTGIPGRRGAVKYYAIDLEGEPVGTRVWLKAPVPQTLTLTRPRTKIRRQEVQDLFAEATWPAHTTSLIDARRAREALFHDG